MQRTRGKSTPNPSFHILPRGMLKLRLILIQEATFKCMYVRTCTEQLTGVFLFLQRQIGKGISHLMQEPLQQSTLHTDWNTIPFPVITY